MANKDAAELERDIARLGERAHAESQRFHADLADVRAEIRSGVWRLAHSRTLLGIAFAVAASAGAWAALRSHRRRRLS